MSAAPKDPQSFNLTINVAAVKDGTRVIATTWGFNGGKYGSLGRVELTTAQVAPPETLEEAARIILTALYGLPYDL